MTMSAVELEAVGLGHDASRDHPFGVVPPGFVTPNNMPYRTISVNNFLQSANMRPINGDRVESRSRLYYLADAATLSAIQLDGFYIARFHAEERKK